MNVLILGASSGIGTEVAHIFSRKGWTVICSARDAEELNRLAADLETRYGRKAYAAAINLADPHAISPFVDSVCREHGNVDCLVVTAGTLPLNEEQYNDETELIRTTMTNYIGVALLINAVARRMADRKAGVVICLSSVAGERGRGKNFVYGASKSALTTYLQGLRMRLHGSGVRIVTVIPGYVDTPMSYGKVMAALAVSPRYVADRIYDLLDCRKDVVYLPPIWRPIMKAIRLIPESLFKRMGSKF